MIGIDPELADPEHGDYRPRPGSPAEDYGCRTFPAPGSARPAPADAALEWGSIPGPASSADGRKTREEVAGTITEDTLWDADTIAVVGEISVADGVLLTVAPGVRIEFQGYYGLSIAGALRAIGTPAAWIEFVSHDSELFSVDTLRVGCWAGIRFDETRATNVPSQLAYCRIAYVKALDDPRRGGTITLRGYSGLAITNSLFEHNASLYGGAVFCSHYAAPQIVGNVMYDNYAFAGGSAICCIDAYPAVANNTLIANHVLNEEYCFITGVIHQHIAKARTASCILFANTSHYFIPGQLPNAKAFYTTYNDVEGGQPGVGNFDADPLLVDSGDHPFSLLEGSPCIDAGSPDLNGITLPELDLAGSPRITNGRIDVGAYEWIAPAATDVPSGERRAAWGYPNPTCAQATIAFALPADAQARLAILDSSGRLVITLHDGVLSAGAHRIHWDGRGAHGEQLPSGSYYWTLAAGAVGSASGRIVRVN